MRTAAVDKATWMRKEDGLWVAFRVKDARAGEEMCRVLSDGKEREITLRSKRRTVNANAYAWTMMGQLAAKLRMKTADVYRQYVQNIGDNTDVVLVREDRMDAWDDAWCAGHIGRMTEDLGRSRRYPDYHNVRVYYGSSDYDRDQMAHLLDMIVADCNEQGIPTVTEREKQALIERWGHEVL
jgi:hypothetical protein